MNDVQESDRELNDLIEEYHLFASRSAHEKWERGKGDYGDAWKDCDPEYMIRRMEEELYEFRQAVEHNRDEQEALEEIGDIINFGLMFLALNDLSDTGSDREGR